MKVLEMILVPVLVMLVASPGDILLYDAFLRSVTACTDGSRFLIPVNFVIQKVLLFVEESYKYFYIMIQ